jgi:hypothetical protein
MDVIYIQYDTRITYDAITYAANRAL